MIEQSRVLNAPAWPGAVGTVGVNPAYSQGAKSYPELNVPRIFGQAKYRELLENGASISSTLSRPAARSSAFVSFPSAARCHAISDTCQEIGKCLSAVSK